MNKGRVLHGYFSCVRSPPYQIRKRCWAILVTNAFICAAPDDFFCFILEVYAKGGASGSVRGHIRTMKDLTKPHDVAAEPTLVE